MLMLCGLVAHQSFKKRKKKRRKRPQSSPLQASNPLCIYDCIIWNKVSACPVIFLAKKRKKKRKLFQTKHTRCFNPGHVFVFDWFCFQIQCCPLGFLCLFLDLQSCQISVQSHVPLLLYCSPEVLYRQMNDTLFSQLLTKEVLPPPPPNPSRPSRPNSLT